MPCAQAASIANASCHTAHKHNSVSIEPWFIRPVAARAYIVVATLTSTDEVAHT